MNNKNSPPLLSVDEALDHLLHAAQPVQAIEDALTMDALGRVLATSLISPIAVPPYDNSAMDGYAVRAAELHPKEMTRLQVSQRIPAGTMGTPLAQHTAARIFTGAPIPAGADAVVMQEDTRQTDDIVAISRAVSAGTNIRLAGEDIAAGATILQGGTRLGPQHIGLAASVGMARVPVYRKLRIATFFTGDELVMPGEALAPGQIYNSNRFTLNSLLRSLGFVPIDLGTVPDSLEATVAVLKQAAQEADVIITSGGVSVGEEDYVKAAVERVGSIDMWRIAMKPGKPLAFGQIENAAFIGLPGNPVSVFVTFCLFARPFLLRSQGVMNVTPRSFWVEANFDWLKPDRRREYLRARLEPGTDGVSRAALFPHQGSGVLTSTVWGDGLINCPAGTPIKRGERVRFIPFSDLLAWH
jgi:molybdopterin molybdotransferase